jgi:hypothetical protein
MVPYHTSRPYGRHPIQSIDTLCYTHTNKFILLDASRHTPENHRLIGGSSFVCRSFGRQDKADADDDEEDG